MLMLIATVINRSILNLNKNEEHIILTSYSFIVSFYLHQCLVSNNIWINYTFKYAPGSEMQYTKGVTVIVDKMFMFVALTLSFRWLKRVPHQYSKWIFIRETSIFFPLR